MSCPLHCFHVIVNPARPRHCNLHCKFVRLADRLIHCVAHFAQSFGPTIQGQGAAGLSAGHFIPVLSTRAAQGGMQIEPWKSKHSGLGKIAIILAQVFSNSGNWAVC